MIPVADLDPRRFRALILRRAALAGLGVGLAALAVRLALAEALAAPL